MNRFEHQLWHWARRVRRRLASRRGDLVHVLTPTNRVDERLPVPSACCSLSVSPPASWQLGRGAYIHAKAQLAQFLIASAWSKTLGRAAGSQAVAVGGTRGRWRASMRKCRASVCMCWPARMAAPLRSAPGMCMATPLPGTPGNSVIGGHRDTHFAFLRDLKTR